MPFINADFIEKSIILFAFSVVLRYNIYSTKRGAVSRMSRQDLTKNEKSRVQEITALRNENAILKEQPALLQEQFDWLKKQVFGRKTEQTTVITDGGTQLSLFPAEMEQAVSVPEKTITVPEHQHKVKRTHDE